MLQRQHIAPRPPTPHSGLARTLSGPVLHPARQKRVFAESPPPSPSPHSALRPLHPCRSVTTDRCGWAMTSSRMWNERARERNTHEYGFVVCGQKCGHCAAEPAKYVELCIPSSRVGRDYLVISVHIDDRYCRVSYLLAVIVNVRARRVSMTQPRMCTFEMDHFKWSIN